MSTLDEVTQFLVDKNTPAQDESVPDEVQDNEIVDDTQEEVVDEEDLSDEDQEGDGEAEKDDEEDEESPYDDDTTEVEVVVDGETKSIPLSELKKAYSLHGATESRLREATEARKEANQLKLEANKYAEEMQQSLVQVVNGLGQHLFAEFVARPDESLRKSNPTRYLEHLEAYQQDQQRIAEQREAFGNLFKQEGEKLAKAKQEHAKQEVELLRTALPELLDKEKGPKVAEKLVEAGKYYGFSEEEIKSMADHRVYLMAHDAQKYRELVANGGKMPKDVEERVRQTRPAKKSRSMASAKRQKQLDKVKHAAAQSGRPEDVAKYLIHKNSQPSRRK